MPPPKKEIDKTAPYLSVREAAKVIGVTESVMYKTLKSSPFPHHHFGESNKGVVRIPRKQLKEFEVGSWNPEKAGVLYGDGPPLCKRCRGEETPLFEYVPSAAVTI